MAQAPAFLTPAVLATIQMLFTGEELGVCVHGSFSQSLHLLRTLSPVCLLGSL